MCSDLKCKGRGRKGRPFKVVGVCAAEATEHAWFVHAESAEEAVAIATRDHTESGGVLLSVTANRANRDRR